MQIKNKNSFVFVGKFSDLIYQLSILKNSNMTLKSYLESLYSVSNKIC